MEKQAKSKAAGSIVAALLAVVMLAGCAASVEPMPGPSGELSYSIDCTNSDSWTACYAKAGEVCGAKGYNIVDRISGQEGYGTYGAYGWSATYETRTLVVECKRG
jgi:hypothetical protein